MIHKAGERRHGWPAVAAVCWLAVVGCSPAPQVLRLGDGTEVFHLSNTKVQPANAYPQVREIKIDGEAFIRVPMAAQPLIIRTRLMLLTITGRTALRVTARSSETGEEADVLYGHVEAKKSYPSPQHEPDTLSAGEEVMVNQTIDLQEKETTDLASLRAWSESLMASVERKNAR